MFLAAVGAGFDLLQTKMQHQLFDQISHYHLYTANVLSRKRIAVDQIRVYLNASEPVADAEAVKKDLAAYLYELQSHITKIEAAQAKFADPDFENAVRRLIAAHLLFLEALEGNEEPPVFRASMRDSLEGVIARADQLRRLHINRYDELSAEQAAKQRAAMFGLVGISFLLVLVAVFVTRKMVKDITRDVDALRASEAQLAHNEERLEAVVENIEDGILTLDEGGAILSANDAAAAIFREKPNALIGRPFTDWLVAPKASGLVQSDVPTGPPGADIASNQNAADKIGSEVEGVRADGKTFPAHIYSRELTALSQRFQLVVVRDLTRQKAIDKAKDEFIATAGHELRTPITIILGYLPLLTETENQLSSKVLEQVGNKIEAAGTHLLEVVDDLLDMAKIESGILALDRKPLYLPTFVNALVEEMQVMAINKGLALSSKCDDCSIFVDEKRFRQILFNIIGNALKFTAIGSVRVIVMADPDTVHITVSDTGIGIPEDKLEVIFDRFAQEDSSSTRAAGGAGLGLAIVKRLVELQQGHIFVGSKLGKGTTFTLSFAKCGELSACG